MEISTQVKNTVVDTHKQELILVWITKPKKDVSIFIDTSWNIPTQETPPIPPKKRILDMWGVNNWGYMMLYTLNYNTWYYYKHPDLTTDIHHPILHFR